MQNKGCGIICEYNPFHNGHKYQIEKVKSMGHPFVVCAMSGDFVQRAEPSFQDKTIRAKNAVMGGGDVVLEIPFPFCCLGAEGFAKAGIEILSKSGLCDSFAFGSECGDIDKLMEIATFLNDGIKEKIACVQKDNPSMSYATIRETLIKENLGQTYANIIKKPNDILAVEYLKSNMCLESPLLPVPIKRSTPRGGFDGQFASSSYIRTSLAMEENKEFATSKMPQDCDKTGIFLKDDNFYNILLINLMLKTEDQLRDVAEVMDGCEYSIVKNAKKAKDYKELLNLLASKTFTDAKIRRMLLFSFFGVTKTMAKESVLYSNILSFSDLGKKMLRENKEQRGMILASNVASIKKNKEAFRQYNYSRLAQEVLYKCRNATPLT